MGYNIYILHICRLSLNVWRLYRGFSNVSQFSINPPLPRVESTLGCEIYDGD